MKIQPTIGRQVWYWRAGADLAGQPEAATVAYVHGESMVNLQVIDHQGAARPETSVSLRQPNDPPWTTTPFAEWMPYQKGQAARTEQLEAVTQGQRNSDREALARGGIVDDPAPV